MMLFCLLAGVGFGLGHHQYYQSFDGSIVKSADQQQWAIRIGTGLAFLTKTAFTAVIGVAFSQYLWVIARRKALTLRSLDAAFTLTSSPTSFFDFGVLNSAKLLALIATASWLLPLIALVTPASLTVESRPTTNVTQRSVPYPNFDITNGVDDIGNYEYNNWSDYVGGGYIVSPSPALRRILTAAASGTSITPVAAPYANSSYSLQFYGPCLKCQSGKDALGSHDFDNFEQVADNNTSLANIWDGFDSADRFTYYKAAAPLYYNIILVATSSLNKTVDTGGVNVTCQLRNASYNVDFTFEQGIPSTTILDLAFEPVINYSTRTTIGELPPNGSRAYLSMLLALADLLNGQFGVQPGLSSNGINGGNSSVLATGLIACPEIIGTATSLPFLSTITSPWMCRNGSLLAAIEDLSHNFTLSLLSSSIFSTTRLVDVTMSFPMNYYNYHPKGLAISYLTGLGVTLACFLIGTWACQSNGYSAWTSFSTIMHTTRNPQLDELIQTDDGGAEGWKSAFRTVKLRYGIVNQEGEMGHAAFGKADTITRISKL